MKSYITYYLVAVISVISLFTFASEVPIQANVAEEKMENTRMVININQADPNTLLSLKGIGNKKAQAIVNYRLKHGDFTDINQLLNVKGIGEQLLEANKNRLKI